MSFTVDKTGSFEVYRNVNQINKKGKRSKYTNRNPHIGGEKSKKTTGIKN